MYSSNGMHYFAGVYEYDFLSHLWDKAVGASVRVYDKKSGKRIQELPFPESIGTAMTEIFKQHQGG